MEYISKKVAAYGQFVLVFNTKSNILFDGKQEGILGKPYKQ